MSPSRRLESTDLGILQAQIEHVIDTEQATWKKMARDCQCKEGIEYLNVH